MRHTVATQTIDPYAKVSVDGEMKTACDTYPVKSLLYANTRAKRSGHSVLNYIVAIPESTCENKAHLMKAY